MALELNTPRHAYYQRRYNVRLPRRAKSRTYLDTTFVGVGVPPAGWDYGMIPVLDASTFVGAQLLSPTTYGSLNPRTYLGLGIYQFTVSSIGTVLFSLEYPSKVQAPGINTVTATLQGFGGSVVMPWLAGSIRYQATSQTALRTFLEAQVGNVIGVTFTGSAALLALFMAPYPWEPMTSAQLNDWVDELDLDVPGNWFALSLAAKKAYLQAQYGTP